MANSDQRIAALRVAAKAYFETPFQQHRLQRTSDFERYLRKRALHLPLAHLRRTSILLPIAVRGPLRRKSGQHRLERQRFTDDFGYQIYLDLGTPSRHPPPFRYDSILAGDALYHPYQLLLATKISDRLRLGLAPAASVMGVDSNARLAQRLLEEARQRTIEFARSPDYTKDLKLLQLLFRIDPIVFPVVSGTVSYDPRYTLSDWSAWRGRQDPDEIMDSTSFSIDELRQAYESLALQTAMGDPLHDWFPILRNAKPSKIEQLEGDALRAQDLYSLAQLLREFARKYLAEEWPEEDDIRWGPQGPDVKRRFFGSEYVTRGRRDVLRRVTREFGLDPQIRCELFVEGSTESGFVDEVATRMNLDLKNRGVAVTTFDGYGSATAKRKADSSWFRKRLRQLREEECFPYPILDREGGVEATLQKLSARGLVPAGFVVWPSDFEESNFSVSELVTIANQVARRDGVPPLKVREVIRSRSPTIVGAINKAFGPKFRIAKNQEWGRRLGAWAMAHKCPTALRDSNGERPIISHLLLVFRGADTSYRATVERGPSEPA